MVRYLIELGFYFFCTLPRIIWGKLHGNLVRVHWGRHLNNFGDCLTPDILKYYGMTPAYISSNEEADIILAGTILQWVKPSFNGYIVGTGGDRGKIPSFPYAKIKAVRGKYTRDCLNLSSDVLLGDPGLLMSYIYSSHVEQIYELGIILHFVDKDKYLFDNIKKRGGVLFINVLDSPKHVVSKIKKCKHIVSSSLHGLIIADAYHIPNAWILNRNTMPTHFYEEKFEYYYSSLDIIDVTPNVIDGTETVQQLINMCTLKPIEKIEQLKLNLNRLFKEICAELKK